MKLRRRALVSGIAVAFSAVAFVGSAVAGNDNGKGSGNGNGSGNSANAAGVASPASPGAGNSASAPGQVKKDPAPASSAPAVQSGPAAPTAAPSSPSSAPAGVKPANDTQKSTTCTAGASAGATTCASADPHANSTGHGDASKRYGNGKTAAQITVSRGGSGATLYGPGNSQPHKVTPCSGRKHGVDVHAVKKDGAAQCGESSSPPPNSPPPPHVGDPPRTTPHADPPTTKPDGGTTVSVTPTTPGKPRDPKPSAKPVHHLGDPSARSAASRVLGRIGVVGSVAAGQTLPFTGFPLWIVAAFGLMLIAGGLSLRRVTVAERSPTSDRP